MDLDFTFGSGANASRIEPDAPFRVLLIGNFSGHGESNNASVKRIDIDNFDEVFASLRPSLKIRLKALDFEIAFNSIDDFHPDELLSNSLFSNAETLVASELTERSAPQSAPNPQESDDATLERLLGAAPEPRADTAAREPGIDLDRLLRDAIAPAIANEADGEAQARAMSEQEAQAILLRELLHNEEFQEIEAVWRGLRWLVFENEAEENVEISLLNTGKSDLAADLNAHRDDLSRSSLYRHVVTDAHARFGGVAYNAIIGNFEFAADPQSIEMLAALGAIATHANAPFIAGALPQLLGGEGFENKSDPGSWTHSDPSSAIQWQALRECAQASSIGLVLPRLIGRLPYGKRGETIERFDFEELDSPPKHRQFLWLSGAFGAAQLLISAFARSAWNMSPGDAQDLEDLPAALYETSEGQMLKPCAESLLSHTEAAQLQDNGVMVFMSHRDRNVVRLARMQSIASPASALAGPWNSASLQS